MAAVQHPTEFEPQQLAAAARSILSCPADVSMVVDGVDDLLADRDDLGMSGDDGRPMLVCPTDSPLAEAATAGRSALVTLTSGVGPAGSRSRDTTLTLAGRLSADGRNDCECCGEPRTQVSMVLNFVLLSRLFDGGREQQYRVPLEHFGSADHRLNRGFLQRSVEHANQYHQDELRRAVAITTGTRMVDVAGVRLSGLLPHRVEITWVDTDGAQSRTVPFARAARSPEELGELLRAGLHAGLC